MEKSDQCGMTLSKSIGGGVALVFCCFVGTAWGAATGTEGEIASNQSWLRDVAPGLLVFGILAAYLWNSQRRTNAWMAIAERHAEKSEKYQEEVLSLLREIAGRPRQTQEPPPLK